MGTYIGTSDWSYSHWKKRFYPKGLSQKDTLSYYSQHFNTVEINMTFYRFPKPETIINWKEKTPDHFKFTIKANRQITHRKRLKNVKNDVRYLYILAEKLGDKLGTLLFQLPPSLEMDRKLLKDFLSDLSPEFKNVMEFRHESWYTQEIYNILRESHVTFCTVSSSKVPDKMIKTSDTAYFRFHGLTGGYKYNYTEEELKKWAEVIKESDAQECYLYFNNDFKAYSVFNAKTLKKLLND